MAKTKPAKKVGGPFLAAAVLCTAISEDSDGIVSAHRIVDEIRVALPHDAPADFPSASKPFETSLFTLIIIRRGDAASGRHQLRLVAENPSGEVKEMLSRDIKMPKHPNGAAMARIRMSMRLHSAGVHWIDVELDGKRLTRMALNIVIQRAEAPNTTPPQGH